MVITHTTRTAAVAAMVACLASGAAVPARASTVIDTGTAAAVSAASGSPTRHEHTVRTYPARGKFRCGDLVLTVNGGTETETSDGDLRNGVAHVSISRIGRQVTLAGSDGRTYRAAGFTLGWFVLEAPHFNKP